MDIFVIAILYGGLGWKYILRIEREAKREREMGKGKDDLKNSAFLSGGEIFYYIWRVKRERQLFSLSLNERRLSNNYG